jgi:hypothetical protein
MQNEIASATAVTPCVYFVQAVELRLIKIGSAKRVWRRLSAIRVGSPDRLNLLGVIPTDQPVKLERELHEAFDYARSHGEWFNPNPELLALIAEHTERPAEEPFLVADRIRMRRLSALPLPANDPRPLRGRRAILAAYKAERGIPLTAREEGLN